MKTYDEFIEVEKVNWKNHREHEPDCTFHQWMETVLECALDDQDYAYAKVFFAQQTDDETQQLKALIEVAEELGLHAATAAIKKTYGV